MWTETFCCDRRLALAHFGHHCPSFTRCGLAIQRCPRSHRHLNLVDMFLYRRERQLPPRERAIASISSMDLRILPEQRRHHFPRLTFCPCDSHSWPFAQRHRIGVRKLLYSADKHNPPSFAAASCIFASVSRSPLALSKAHSPFSVHVYARAASPPAPLDSRRPCIAAFEMPQGSKYA